MFSSIGMLPFPWNISPVPIFYIFLRYWFMIVISALMFLMPKTVPSVCSLNTDRDFTLEGFNNDLRHTFSYLFCFSERVPLKLNAFQRVYFHRQRNAERFQTGFLNASPVCHWLTKHIVPSHRFTPLVKPLLPCWAGQKKPQRQCSHFIMGNKSGFLKVVSTY